MANWLPYERYSRPRSETFIWYSWVIRSYIHLYGPGISIKASRRYHGNHQEKNMSIDEAPCEAFNLMHILELPIVGHIKPGKEFLSDIQITYITQISVFELLVWTIHIAFCYKHTKWYNIPIPIIIVACTLLYYRIIGKFGHYVHVIVYDRYSSLLWSISLNIHGWSIY